MCVCERDRESVCERERERKGEGPQIKAAGQTDRQRLTKINRSTGRQRQTNRDGHGQTDKHKRITQF